MFRKHMVDEPRKALLIRNAVSLGLLSLILLLLLMEALLVVYVHLVLLQFGLKPNIDLKFEAIFVDHFFVFREFPSNEFLVEDGQARFSKVIDVDLIPLGFPWRKISGDGGRQEGVCFLKELFSFGNVEVLGRLVFGPGFFLGWCFLPFPALSLRFVI